MEPGLRRIESRYDLQYVRIGLFNTRNFKSFRSFVELDSLGIVTHGDWNLIPDYLMASADATIKVERVPQKKAGPKFNIDQRGNDRTITFLTSGVFESRALICGRVATVLSDSFATELYQSVVRELMRGFKKLSRYMVGPEALELLDQGIRLTPSVKFSSEMDLARRRPEKD